MHGSKPSRPQKSLAEEVKECVQRGAIVGAVLSIVALVVFLIFGHAPYDRMHSSVFVMISAYLLGGVGGGAIVGLLLRFATTSLLAFLIGFLASVPFSIGLAIAMAGSEKPGLLVFYGGGIRLGLWRTNGRQHILRRTSEAHFCRLTLAR
jgi:hypothetical protein